MALTVRKGTVRLSGSCGPEEAEDLQAKLLKRPGAAVDMAGCEHMHAAVLQVLLAAGAPVHAPPEDDLLRRLTAGLPRHEAKGAPRE